ncbi:hypothetical protein QYF61_002124 [Mycteria americana]|uniref:Uncharacterized protein n=1 Tax=Mycteria americana TaxID=33587 RepID=A0AAN7N879_MYCAM|nr:hypothetical protein QYF61_002124 [Mycteria americana]
MMLINTKLGEVALTPEGCAAIKRDLDRLEKLADRNLMKFNKGELQSLTSEEEQSQAHYMLGANGLESTFAEKNLGILMEHQPAMYPCGKEG